jgi:flagellar hook-length control protein FliK
LPPEAVLTLSMLMPGAAPNPAASPVPAGAAGHDTAARTDSPAPVAASSAPVVAPAVALPTVTFALPATAQADSPVSDATAAAATASATAAKPAMLAPHVVATINTQSMSAVSGPAGGDVDSSAAAIKAGAEQLGAATDTLKAVATPVRAEPVIDMPAPGITPTPVSAESMAVFTNTPGPVGTGGAVPGATVSVPFGQPAWGQALGNQVVWALNQGLPAAALHLSPPELGPVSVHIRLDQDQASIAFSSPHVAVRDAIEAAMPRLRDMLGDQGIALVNVNVSQHGSSHARAQDYTPGNGRGAVDSREDGVAMATPVRQAVLGVLDLYA